MTDVAAAAAVGEAAGYLAGVRTLVRGRARRRIRNEVGPRPDCVPPEVAAPPGGAAAPVVLVPGWLAGPGSMRPLVHALDRAGVDTSLAAVGRNLDCYEATVGRLAGEVQSRARAAGRRVVLVGHSRGGVLAAEVARRQPECVAAVVALAAPLRSPFRAHAVVVAQMVLLATASALGVRGLVRSTCPAGACCARIRAAADTAVGLPLVSVTAGRDGIIDPLDGIVPGADVLPIPDTTHTGILCHRRAVRAVLDVAFADHPSITR